jgi:hypothetical protein
MSDQFLYSVDMKRREFIMLLAGSGAWPLAARAEQASGTKLVGMLLSQFEGSQEARDRVAAVREALQKLGWTKVTTSA